LQWALFLERSCRYHRSARAVTALVLLYPKLATARIVGTDIAHAVPLTLAGGIGHWLLGSIDLQVFASLILGSVPGILLGKLCRR